MSIDTLSMLRPAIWTAVWLSMVGWSPKMLAQEPTDFRVMTYNVRYKNTIDSINNWDFRKDNVAALIRYHGADVVGLQEANKEQIHDLEALLPEYDWYGVPRVEGPAGEFTPIFFRKDRFDRVDAGSFWYSETPEVKESKSWDAMFPRIASWCLLTDKRTGKAFYFFNTHFDHRGEIARQKSAEILRHYADSLAAGKPLIITGDFNSRDSSVVYRHMVSGQVNDAMDVSETGHYGPVNTSSGFWVRPEPIRARIDYIFVNDRVAVKQHATLTDQQEGRYYSDHLPVAATVAIRSTPPKKADISVGAYYFDGWAGRNVHADDANEPWAKNAPTHLTRRMVEEFPEREPVWGWSDDSLTIMERQIDLAADNGVDFFLFCWYWRDNKGPINEEAIRNDPKHTSLQLYLKARNKDRVKFALLIANHVGGEILGEENWKSATEHMMPYFSDQQHVRVDEKPLIVLFDPRGATEGDLSAMQRSATAGGLPGLTIAGCNASPEQTGITHRTHYNVVPGYRAGTVPQQYDTLMNTTKEQWRGTKQQPYIPQLTVGWDKRPWEGPQGLNQVEGWYYPDRTPQQFKKFLEDAITWMDEHPNETTKERIALVYAWNELGEGGYLVPTKGDPEASYLDVIKQVTSKVNDN